MNWPFSVSRFNKHLLQKGIICLNLVRIWYIFPTRRVVLNAVKEPGSFSFFLFFFFFFLGGGGGGGGWGGCALIRAFWTVSQWVNASQIAFDTSISPTHTPCEIVESRRDL